MMKVEAKTSTWVVYIVLCSDGSLYTGITTDIRRRLREHNTGKGAKYTRGRFPVTLEYSEIVKSRSAAMKTEARIKSLTKAEKAELCFLKSKE